MKRTMISFLSQEIQDLVTQAFGLLAGTPEDRQETATNLISRAEELRRTAENGPPERKRLLVEAETLIVTACTLTRSKLAKLKVPKVPKVSTSSKTNTTSNTTRTLRSTVLSASQQHQPPYAHLRFRQEDTLFTLGSGIVATPYRPEVAGNLLERLQQAA